MKQRLVAISWVVALVISGCGGGGSGAVDARGSFDAPNRTDRVYVIKQVTLPATQEMSTPPSSRCRAAAFRSTSSARSSR